IQNGARVILMSHLGRPEGVDSAFSLAPAADHLSELLGTDVLLTDDCVGDGIEMIVRHLKSTQVILLENLRFHEGEEKNDPAFARQLASLAEVYINDAFGSSHREHASIYGVPQIMPIKGCGFLIKKELQFLNRLLNAPEHPYVAVLGGSKVSDKIKTIENLFFEVDVLCVGGAMAHAFRLAGDPKHVLPPNAKQPKSQDIAYASQLLEKARRHEVKLILPIDDPEGVPPGFDIGPQTIELFTKEIRRAKTVFWNGPVGMFEDERYAKGSLAVAQAMAEVKGLKVVGGGDTVSALNLAGVADQMTHVSTGGGATLEFLEGNGLPGITILDTIGKKSDARISLVPE
ncbi:MAG TPA: phosphoglycerate kinase, partial [Oligoflexia bacterium]|nr:phosphoglycerate kinase [Oligoflexia bacterium]